MSVDINKILWPTDFSENAALALPYVNSLSEKYQCEVHVLYVLEAWGSFGAWYGEDDSIELEKVQKWARETAEKRLNDICAEHLKGCPLYVKHIGVGDPAEEILDLADEANVDLILMTTQGRKGRFSFGSVTERIVRYSAVPVLVVPVEENR